jgi:hypothetical protein
MKYVNLRFYLHILPFDHFSIIQTLIHRVNKD